MIISQLSKVIYSGNGTNRSFSIPFDYNASSDSLKIYVRTSSSESGYLISEISSAYSYNKDTKTLTYPNTESIPALTSLQEICILRTTPFTQLLNSNSQLFKNSDVEFSIDKLTKITQELSDLIKRSIKVNPFESEGGDVLDFDSNVKSVNGVSGDVIITKSTIGLNNVDNTSDINKPLSTATIFELSKKIEDSVSDGKVYGRTNGTWTEIVAEVNEAPVDDNYYVRQNESWKNLSPEIASIITRLNSVEGRGGYLQAYNFGVATPTATQLNDYALSQIQSISNPSEIFNGTRVKNTFNNNLWVLANTQNTIPPVFEWINNGLDTVSIATKETAGVVKASSASGGISVAADGTASVNGFNDKFDKTGGTINGNLTINRNSTNSAISLVGGGTYNILEGSSYLIALYRSDRFVDRFAGVTSDGNVKWYVYKNGVAKELGLTDASELSYSGPVSAATVKGAIENVNTKAEAVIADLESDMNKVFPIISDLGNLSGIEVNVTPEACYKGVANGSFKLVLPIPTDGRTHSFRLFVKAETNASITFNKKIMYDSSITDYGDLISGTYYDYIFTWQPILSKWQMFRKTYQTEPYTLQLLLRFNGNMQDSSPTNLSAGWIPFNGESGVVVDTVNRKFPDDYVASIKKANAGLVSALADAEKLKAILTTIGTGDFTIGIWVYCPENGVSHAYADGLFRFVKSNGYENINDFGMPFGWDGFCALGVGNNYDQQHVWWNAGAEVWTQGWHYLEVNRKAGVAYITFDGILKTSGAYTVDVSAGKDNLAYMQLFGWNASGSTAVSFQEFFILSKASHIADFTPPTAPFVVEQE